MLQLCLCKGTTMQPALSNNFLHFTFPHYLQLLQLFQGEQLLSNQNYIGWP